MAKVEAEKESRQLRRRDFIRQSGLVFGGTLVGAIGLGSVTRAASTESKKSPEWPWPYEQLDPEVVRKKGHFLYYKGA